MMIASYNFFLESIPRIIMRILIQTSQKSLQGTIKSKLILSL